MKDYLLKEFFESWRWERAIEAGIVKGINKSELRRLCSPEYRLALLNAIVTDNYEIAPSHQALIPKGNGEFRTVYVNEGMDRIFLSIVNDMLFELDHDSIHPACKSYQKGIGCGKVVQEAVKSIKHIQRQDIGFKADLSKYFDSVPIEFIDKEFDRIENRFGKSKIIDVIRKYYHTDLCFDPDGKLIEHYQSLKQGCAVASFLADCVLFHLDKKLNNLCDGFYVRYSDDILFIGTNYEEGMEILKEELEKMNMHLNPKKVEYLDKDRWFKFLGFMIKGNQITLSKSRVKDFQKEIESRTIKKRNITKTKAINSVNRYLYKGDGTYSWATSVLPIVNVQKDVDTLNEFVMDCIRAAETGKTKVGGLGCVTDKENYTILRGIGRNVKANKIKTEKDIEGYKSIRCMQNALNYSRPLYDTLVREM
ncbi:reverse transcriptase domain-containing protein [Blautia intestinalis]|uniref:reverse transcriptase domain-containing protein n=1 Tax=Blautia intestinalis TaxID=2763028 RepID=UPI0022E4E5CB|nr:reverse transcriptase domain-containing protein [Blautia intestinalis]